MIESNIYGNYCCLVFEENKTLKERKKSERNMQNTGVSLVSLIISIITIIILASIVIFNGMRTPGQAIYARFTSDVASLQETVESRYNELYAEYASKGKVFTDQDIYRWLATGSAVAKNIEQILPSEAAQYGATLPASGTNGSVTEYYTWYLQRSSENNMEVVEIDLASNELKTTLPVYEDRKWKMRTTDGTVFLDPPVEYNGKMYATLQDVQGGGTNAVEGNALDINPPILTAGMIPVYHDGTVWRKANRDNNGANKWYDYSQKQWANMVTVSDGSRGRYASASIGTEIDEEDVLGYWVWIPRYAYKINSNRTVDVVFLRDDTNNFYDGVAGVGNDYIPHPVFTNAPEKGGWDKELTGIWVAKFESSSSATSLIPDTGYQPVNANDGNTVIPTVEPGARAVKSSTINTYGGKSTSTTDDNEFVKVIPGVTSWRNLPIYSSSNNISVKKRCMVIKSEELASHHGITADSHMMKNTEWGAVAYLSRSQYGKEGQVWNNSYSEGECYQNNNAYGMSNRYVTLTGMAGPEKNDSQGDYDEKRSKTYHADGSITITYDRVTTPTVNGEVTKKVTANYSTKTFYPYNHEKGFEASTTGNIYGVYDMAGGAWEYMNSFVDNRIEGTTTNAKTYFKGTYDTEYSAKYYNKYASKSPDDGTASVTQAMSQANFNRNAESDGIRGDATNEVTVSGGGYSSTGAWDSDYAYFPGGTHPWFIRGGHFYYSTSAGVFAFTRYHGSGYYDSGFRVVLVP